MNYIEFNLILRVGHWPWFLGRKGSTGVRMYFTQ